MTFEPRGPAALAEDELMEVGQVKTRALLPIGMIAIFGATILAGTAAAQEPVAPHPAHIHAGSCPSPGDVIGPLNDVSDQFLMGDGAMMSQAAGQVTPIPVKASFTSDVPVAFTDLLAAPHSIVVHSSANDMATYIACGDLIYAIGPADIVAGLGPLNASGYGGVAMIHDDGDSTVSVNVYIVAFAPMTAPAPSPAA
jgi:hypothetical protein